MDKEKLREVLDAVKEGFPQCGEGKDQSRGGNTVDSQCCCPSIVIYLIDTNCLVINNAGCPDWQFCNTGLIAKK